MEPIEFFFIIMAVPVSIIIVVDALIDRGLM